jgi:hypothetical protein
VWGKRGMATCIQDMMSDYYLDFIGLQETMKNIMIKVFSARLILVIISFGSGL